VFAMLPVSDHLVQAAARYDNALAGIGAVSAWATAALPWSQIGGTIFTAARRLPPSRRRSALALRAVRETSFTRH